MRGLSARPGLLLAALAVSVLAFVSTAGGATSPYSWRDGDSGYVYTCPDPPAGFTANPNNPLLTTPSRLNIRAAWDNSLPGTDQESVSCFYISPGGHDGLWVSANLALPLINVNPFSDFYVGCGANPIDYKDPDFTSFFVESKTRWAYARFTDYGNALGKGFGNVPAFEKIARELLHNVEPAAHNCKTDSTHPTTVPALWSFDFTLTASGGGLRASLTVGGTFDTRGGPNARNQYKVPILHTLDSYPLTVTRGGGSHTVALRFSDPTYFYLPPVSKLGLQVKVVSSTDPACPKGSSGTMTLTTTNASGVTGPTTGKLDLCHSLFAGATQQLTGQIISGDGGPK